MKTKKNCKNAFAVAVVLSGIMMVSCTDSKYDLSNLDKTIAIGSEQGLALPGNNSTRDIAMKDVFDLPKDGIVKVNEKTGEYVISQSDIPSGASIVIDKVEMNKEKESDDDYDYDFAEIFGNLFGSQSRSNTPGDNEGLREIKHFSFRSKTPEAIKALNMAKFNSKINIALNFSTELTASIDELNKLVVNVPTYFNLDVNAFQVKSDNSESAYPPDVFDADTNTLTLSSFALNQTGVRVVIALKGITFNQVNDLDLSRGYYLTMDSDSIKLEGGVNLLAVYNVAGARAKSPMKESKFKDLSIACSTQVGDITIDGGVGRFKPEIDLSDGLGQFAIGDLPDFLDDEEVKLKVKNPHIILHISNNINLEGTIKDAKIVAKMKDGSKKMVSLSSFAIKSHDNNSSDKSTTTTIIVANDKTSLKDINVNYDCSSTVTSEKDMTDLMEDIINIESISFECNASTNENEKGEVDLGYEYFIQPDFEFNAPLEFAAGSTIAYKDTINGWHEDLQDLLLTNDSYVEMSATVINQLPMNMTVDVSAVEVLENGMLHKMGSNQFEIKVWTDDDEAKNLIYAGTTDNPKSTKLHIRLKQNNNEALSNIDGIVFKAKAVTPPNQLRETLKETSSLRLDKISLFLKGKVITNLDK